MTRNKQTNAALVKDLVLANHILFTQGVLDGFGHVSVRDPDHPQCFLLARSMAPANVTARDILRFGLDGEPLRSTRHKVFVERFIHSEIYRARPDVQAIVHSHSPSVIPFGVTGTPLRPVSHMGGFLGMYTPNFEIREAAGPASDMLIRDRKLGAALAATLARASYALMRGHGSVAVGESIKHVVYRAVYAEANARLQNEALRLGPINYLTEEEALNAMRSNDAVLERPWDLWTRLARKRRP
jgi:HCOMODA/2-hydroxy-3-carboxy-muconic semialdehyde decarboxylase